MLGASLAAASALAQEQVALTWQMWSGNEAETAVWERLADMVTEEHPDITVELVTSPWMDYWTRLPVLAASGQLADIVSMQSLRMPNFYSILEPLNARVEADGFDIDAFVPSIVGGMSFGGALYGLPYDVGPWLIFYNKDMFEQAGLDLPEPGWTVDEFLAAAEALTGDDVHGFGLAPIDFSVFATATGATYLAGDGTLNLTDPSAIEAAATLIGMVAESGTAPIVTGANPAIMVSGRFDAGNVAMQITGPWDMVNKNANVAFELGLTSMPRGDGPLRAATAGSGFGIATTSDHKDAAWRAIQVLTGPEAAAYLGSQGRALPSRIAQQPLWYEVAAADVFGATEALTYSLENSAVYGITGNWNEVENLLNQYFVPAFTGDATVEETMQTIQSLASQ